MNQLIDKFLNGQATLDEEQQIAELLRQQEDMDQWLTEDETADYDRIVRRRRAKRYYLRWAMAAALALLIAAGTMVLWPKRSVSDDVVAGRTDVVTNPATPAEQPAVAAATTPETAASTTAPAKATVRRRSHAVRRPSSADSLQYYIARLEKELEQVTDSSTYTAKAEQVIRADARLQRLVQRIMIGELTQSSQTTQSMNINNKEEQP